MAVLISADGNVSEVSVSQDTGMDELIKLVGGPPYVAYEPKLPSCKFYFRTSNIDAPLNERASKLLGTTVYGSVVLVEDPPFQSEPG